MIYVFDSSFITTLIVSDEKNPLVDALYAKIEDKDERHAPQLVWYEMANIFKNLIRRKRYSNDYVLQLFPRLAAFQLIIDYESGTAYSQKLLQLCFDYDLSAYDAAYLELAVRKKAVLCTLDDGLRAAAKKHGVAIME